MLSLVSNPNISLTIKETGTIMLPVTGTLLGLVYAALIYWLQGGLSKLEYSKTLLEDLMIADARILLDLLIGSSILSLFAIFEANTLINISFWLFVLLFVKDLLNLIAEQGYITTLFSKKFIPVKYGQFRQYLRKLRNAGLAGWLRPLFLITIVVIYPIYISIHSGSFWNISSQKGFFGETQLQSWKTEDHQQFADKVPGPGTFGEPGTGDRYAGRASGPKTLPGGTPQDTAQ